MFDKKHSDAKKIKVPSKMPNRNLIKVVRKLKEKVSSPRHLVALTDAMVRNHKIRTLESQGITSPRFQPVDYIYLEDKEELKNKGTNETEETKIQL